MTEKQNSPAEALTPLWKVLLLGGGGIVGLTLLTVLLSLYVSFVLALIVGVLLGLALLIGGSVYAGPAMVAAGIMAVACSMSGAYFFLEYHELRQGEVIRGVSVGNAPQHESAAAFVFTDAVPAHNMSGLYVHVTTITHGDQKGTKQRVSYYVVPLVSETWRAGDPVPAWLGDTALHKLRKWTPGHGAAARAGFMQLEHYARAVADAEKKYDLRSESGAPILQYIESPEAELEKRRSLAWASSIFWPAAFILFMIGWRIYLRIFRPAAA